MRVAGPGSLSCWRVGATPPPFLGPTDLKIWPSEVKYLEKSDFDVQKSLAPPKSAKNYEKPKKKSKNKNRKKKNRIFFRICCFGFSSFSADFGGARPFLTPKSDSLRYFASDGQIFRSVRRLKPILWFFTVRTLTRGRRTDGWWLGKYSGSQLMMSLKRLL